jgi:hypothetical protein
MKAIAVFAVLLPLTLAAGACTKRTATSPVAPEPPDGDRLIREAIWITDGDQIVRAAAAAARHPLVQASIAEYGAARLSATPDYTIRAIGATVGGTPVEFTTLPFISDGDPTHGVFLTIGSVGETVVTQRSEMIVAREPRLDEPGFTPLSIPGGVVWIREADAVAQRADGFGAPQRLNVQRFMACLMATASPACDAGASIASQIAPAVPQARAVGCAVGVAAAALGCFAGNGAK